MNVYARETVTRRGRLDLVRAHVRVSRAPRDRGGQMRALGRVPLPRSSSSSIAGRGRWRRLRQEVDPTFMPKCLPDLAERTARARDVA